jgi:DNA replication protein DnaC
VKHDPQRISEPALLRGLKIAHFPTVKTLDDFDFKFQPSVDQRVTLR